MVESPFQSVLRCFENVLRRNVPTSGSKEPDVGTFLYNTCGGGPRWRGRTTGYGFGKRLGRSPSAAGISRPAKLGLVLDDLSRKRCSLDTGSQVLLWPPTSVTSTGVSNIWLMAANGTPIKAFGRKRREIKIGGKSYMFIFLIAQVPRPILGIDFLEAFGMSLDLRNRRLLHSGASTWFTSVSSQISGINMVRATGSSSFARLLREFLEITDEALVSRTSCHGVECFINSTGPPVRTPPRRLPPDKLEVAKRYFEVMCAAGNCRSDSSWSSGLHMVPKKD